tara:strand:- start:4985 stop:5782 length:798 start_codon:yes stop_codon:yes gene_type:complete
VGGDFGDEELLRQSKSAFREIERIERVMSFHDPESELSRINRDAHQRSVDLSKDLTRVLEFALQLSRETDGLYDLCVGSELARKGALPNLYPDRENTPQSWRDVNLSGRSLTFRQPLQLDLGGIAKGYAVDCAINQFPDGSHVCVNAGGDLRMSHWESEVVGVKTPSRWRAGRIVELPMERPAVATSATYYLEGKSVILSPESGRPIRDRRSVSVFANECMIADALTKVAFLVPDASPIFQAFHAKAIAVDRKGGITPLFPQCHA